jgi:hypothetical protein
MISLVVLVIVAACAAGMYLKGTLVQAVAMIFNAILAGFAALAFYEMLAACLLKYVSDLAVWAPLICFVLLFIVVFAVLQTVAMQIHKEKTDMGLWPERVGRVIGGILLGYVVTGNLLLAAAMAPIPGSYPYPRFEERNPDPSRPAKPLLSPDGFVSGLFSVVSQGSLSALSQPRSFGMLHAGFVDSLYLNRQKSPGEVPISTKEAALESSKGSVREAPASLRDAEGQPPSVPTDRKLMIVRAAIRKSALSDAGKFTLSQWRLVCAPRGQANPLAAKGQAVYPIGYLNGGTFVHKSLDELISVSGDTVRDTSKAFDFVFAVPSDQIPILIGFKANNLEQLSAPLADDASVQPLPPEREGQPMQGGRPGQTPPGAQRGGPGGNRSNRGGANSNGGGGGLSPAGQAVIGGALDPDINPQ